MRTEHRLSTLWVKIIPASCLYHSSGLYLLKIAHYCVFAQLCTSKVVAVKVAPSHIVLNCRPLLFVAAKIVASLTTR